MRTFSLATIERQGPHQEPEEARQVAALVIDGRLYPLDTLAPRRRELQSDCSTCSSAGTRSTRRSRRSPRASIRGRAASPPTTARSGC